MRYRRLLPLAALLLIAALPAAFADQIVYFVNGKGIVAKSVEKGDKFTILEMEGGGKVGVPTDQILRIEDVVPPSAPAAPVAPPPAPVAPPAAPQQQLVTAAPPPATPTTTAPPTVPGPAMGGRPVGGPNDGLARVTPLEVGGGSNPNPAAPQRPAPQAQAGPGQGGPMMGRMAGGRPNLADIRNRMAGRGGFAAGRFGRPNMNRAGSPPDGAQAPPPQGQGAGQPPQAAAKPQAQPQPQATPAPQPPPAPSVEPEDQSSQADDANEQPSDPPASEEGDSSGNNPGSAS